MKVKNYFVAIANGVLVFILLTACNTLLPRPAPTPTLQPLPTTGTQYFFAANRFLIPTTQEQTKEFAFNLDGDLQNSRDNKFGDLLTLLTSASQGIELQATLDQAVMDGQIVSLNILKASDPLNDKSVSWSFFLGHKPQVMPKFDGTDQFTVDTDAPVIAPIVGSLTNGHFIGGPGSARVQMYLLGQMVDVKLSGVYLEADVTANGCANGKLGGGLSVEEFRGKILPALLAGLDQVIKSDETVAGTLLPIFDTDRNGIISIEEFESNPLLMLAVSPDLDLLDASGSFNPNQDGVKDSYSLGIGFTCVPAVFTQPVE